MTATTYRSTASPAPMPPRTAAATIQHLINCGMTVQDIARASGCHFNTIHRARRGRAVRTDTETLLTAVRANLSSRALIPGFGATRRVRAAIAVGHTETAFAAQARLGLPYISELAAGTRPVIMASTHDRIDAAYRVLIASPAPRSRGASRARNRARAAGWPTPEQWDDLIDDPTADPATWLRTGDVDVAGLVEDAEWLRKQTGDSWESIARQIGLPKDTLHQYRTRVRRRAEQELAA